MIGIWIVKWSFLNQEPVKSQNVNIETEMQILSEIIQYNHAQIMC